MLGLVVLLVLWALLLSLVGIDMIADEDDVMCDHVHYVKQKKEQREKLFGHYCVRTYYVLLFIIFLVGIRTFSRGR